MEEDRIFTVDGPIWTSAGMTAGFDLVLAMVDSDMGSQAAKEVARLLVISQRRIGGQKQLTALLELRRRGASTAAVALCGGGGQGDAAILRAL